MPSCILRTPTLFVPYGIIGATECLYTVCSLYYYRGQTAYPYAICPLYIVRAKTPKLRSFMPMYHPLIFCPPVMRISGSYHVLLNTHLWAQMKCSRANQKNIRITAQSPQGTISVFLITVGRHCKVFSTCRSHNM